MTSDPTSLDRLHEVIEPPPVPWWPPAPGWYWVLGAVAVLLAIAGVRALLRWQRNRYRREALAEWKQNAALLDDRETRAGALVGFAELLKRTALSAWSREEVAALTGESWLAFLDRTGGTTGFSSGLGALLENAAYDPRSAAVLEDARARKAAALVRRWIMQHRVGDPPRARPRNGEGGPRTITRNEEEVAC